MILKKKTIGFSVLYTLAMAFSAGVMSEEKPLWEFGAGVASLYNPDYLGANQETAYALPIPFINYRGKLIRADRDGVRGFIYESEKLDLNLSFSGSLPVNSKDNDAREGMDDLDLMLEVGPTLQYQLLKNSRHLLRADWPVRGGFSVGSKFMAYQGWTTNPRIHHEMDLNRWKLTTTLGPVFSNSRYHGFYYDVDRQDIRPGRDGYESDSGYTGTRFSTGLKRRIGDYFIAGKVTYYNIGGASNEDSPLIKKDDYFGVSLVLVWVFGKSDTMVSVE
ncbi:MAG: outer membrane protein [Gammaproteobacteria bacterium]|jgi:outer membrane protein